MTRHLANKIFIGAKITNIHKLLATPLLQEQSANAHMGMTGLSGILENNQKKSYKVYRIKLRVTGKHNEQTIDKKKVQRK